MTSTRVLVVGVGNVLHGDDGFGVEVARRLGERPLPPGVTVAETGIGGIHLVHELMAGYDALVVIDAVDRGRAPGTVMVIDAEVVDVGELRSEERHDLLADMHLATPERALMVAKATGVLPERNDHRRLPARRDRDAGDRAHVDGERRGRHRCDRGGALA